jgi:hypothetical protein
MTAYSNVCSKGQLLCHNKYFDLRYLYPLCHALLMNVPNKHFTVASSLAIKRITCVEIDSISTDDRRTKLWIIIALILQPDFVVSNPLYPISRYSLPIKTRRLRIHGLRASSNRATFVSALGTISNPRWTAFNYCYSLLSAWLVLTNPLQRAGPLLEHLTVAQMVNKPADPYGTWNFITVFTRVRHLSPSSLNAENRRAWSSETPVRHHVPGQSNLTMTYPVVFDIII